MNQRKCALCGELFTPHHGNQKYCKGPHMKDCPICGKSFEYFFPDKILMTCSHECAQEQRRRTSIKQYGVPNPSQSEEMKARVKKTMMEKYGVENPAQIPEVKEKIRKSEYEIKNVSSDKLPELANKCINVEMVKIILDQFEIEYETEYNLENTIYDIYVPSKHILLCIVPTSNYNVFRVNKEKVCLKKTKLAAKYNLRCIHIFDWDDPQKILLLFEPKKRIYARECTVENLERVECDIFLNMFHLQGACRSQKVRYGLYYKDKLVQVMTFGLSRYTKKHQWELLRLCSDSEYEVIGGASKMFTKFIREQDPESIVSYCDVSKFTGDVYFKLGMSVYNVIEPNKVWSRGIEKITDRLLCRVGYDRLFETDFGKGVSNEQLMIDHGWLPVHDCGQIVYTWTKSRRGGEANDCVEIPN